MLSMQQQLLLAALSLAAVHATDQSTNPYGPGGICIVHSLEVVNELLDSSVYIWAATKRCGEFHDRPYECMIDVGSAVEAITKAITVMIKALTECGSLSHTGCGVAVGKLISSLAGIEAATGEILENCPLEPPPKPRDVILHTGHDAEGKPEGVPLLETALCIVDAKASLRSIFVAARAFMTVKEHCKEGSKECAANSLAIVAALAGLGGYLAGTVGHCTPMPPHPHPLCAKGISMITKNLAEISESGIEIEAECKSESTSRPLPLNSSSKSRLAWNPMLQASPYTVARFNNMSNPLGTPAAYMSLANTAAYMVPTARPRLYDEEFDNEDRDEVEDDWQKGKIGSFSSSKVSGLNLALVMLLPITAFVSFAVGWSRHRSSHLYESLREVNVA